MNRNVSDGFWASGQRFSCTQSRIRSAVGTGACRSYQMAGVDVDMEASLYGQETSQKPFGFWDVSLSKKPHCIVAKWLLVVGEDRKAEKVATCGGRVS